LSSADLLTRIDQAFASNDNAGGLELLREYTVNFPHDAASWHRRAVVEEQIGDWASAGDCHYQCIQAAPAHALAYLYAGSWLQQTDKIEAAVACYSLAQEVNPMVLEIWRQHGEPEPTKIKSARANQLLRQYLSEQHRQSVSNAGSRIKNAVWVQSHDVELDHISTVFAPDLFYIPGITQKPFYPVQEFDWATEFCDHKQIIQAELHGAVTNHVEDLGIRPYLPEDIAASPSLQHLAGSPNWSAIDLYRNGEVNNKTIDEFPKTLELIQSVPTYGLDESPFEVFFSVLQPKNTIGDHFGQSNHSLTVHLGLDTPEGSYLEVAAQKRAWHEGELLIFDDSFLHSAHNDSQAQRTILLFSIWHPSLTDEERQGVQLAFNTRQRWMASRREHLAQLITAV